MIPVGCTRLRTAGPTIIPASNSPTTAGNFNLALNCPPINVANKITLSIPKNLICTTAFYSKKRPSQIALATQTKEQFLKALNSNQNIYNINILPFLT